MTTPQISPPRPPGHASEESRPTRFETGRLSAADLETARADPERRVGRHVILDRLGRGGYGHVFRAWDPALGREVALKVLDPQLARDTDTARFEQEAVALGKLRHPNVVAVHDVGLCEHGPFIALELIDGETLRAAMLREKLSPRRLAAIFADLAAALAHVHARGILHRDLKPENVILARDGRVVLTDFGLAWRASAQQSLTATGEVLGTPAFMSPEQVVGDRDDLGPATDVYGLGASLYEGLVGRPPHEERTAMATLESIASRDPLAPRQIDPSVPEALNELVVLCLAREPTARPDVRELAAALRGFAAGEAAPVLSPRSSDDVRADADAGEGRAASIAVVVLAAAALVAAVGLVVVLGVGDDPAPDSNASPSPAEVEPGPPPPPDGWRRAYRLGAGADPRPVAPALWADDRGREADPLGIARGEGPPAVAFAGRVEVSAPGCVRVRYALEPDELAAVHPFNSLLNGQETLADHVGETLRIVAPNDAGDMVIPIGSARWLRPTVTLGVTRPPPGRPGLVDGDRVGVVVTPWIDRRPPSFFHNGRAKLAVVDGRHRIAIADQATHRFTFELFGGAGRFDIDGVVVDGVGPSEEEARAVQLLLCASETVVTIEELIVEGEPVRPDRAAAALVPGFEAPAHVRLVLEFELPDEDDAVAAAPDGGPFLAVGAPDGDAIVVELAGRRLILRRGRAILGAAELPPGSASRGRLVLERRDDRFLAEASLGATVSFQEVDPTPLQAWPVRAFYGSTGPAVRVEGLTADVADPTPGSAGGAGVALAAWRRGVATLAPLLAPLSREAAALRGRGPIEAARRRDVAASALGELRRAAESLEDGAVREDALARACLAGMLAGDAAGTRAAAERLVEAGGRARAIELIDRLSCPPRPPFTRRIVADYPSQLEVPVLAARVELALALFPEKEDWLAFDRSDIVFRQVKARLVGKALAPVEERPILQGMLDDLVRAEVGGYPPYVLASRRGEIFEWLGRPVEAAAAWDAAARLNAGYWWAHLRRSIARDRVGDAAGAIEAAIVAIDLAPRSQVAVRHLGVALARGRAAGLSGRVALAALALARTTGPPGAGAEAIGRVLPAGPRGADRADVDLAVWALVIAGRPVAGLEDRVRRAGPDRPVLELLAAREQPDDARAVERARELVAESVFLRTIARYDPALSALLARD